MKLDISWHRWKELLGKAKDAAESLGVSDENINKTAYKLEDFLSNNVEPGNPQQRMLNEMWSLADDDERKVLSSLVTRMAKKDTGKNQ
ncbi:DUF3243 domain-containing protein [Desulfolucanica intricata]|uniref:DUF3243 domain-containing protein n=1 Tax=Desulfolucanica intricata TaxID=1285191 RepID=UPI00082C2148|nr:DUF3243 domain-containing protein [Desulfolucanica intricata]